MWRRLTAGFGHERVGDRAAGPGAGDIIDHLGGSSQPFLAAKPNQNSHAGQLSPFGTMGKGEQSPPNGKLDSKPRSGDSMENIANTAAKVAQMVGEVCLMTENPFRALKAAGKGRLAELEKLHRTEPARLTVKDTKGRSALHYACLNGHVSAAEFLLTTAGLDIADKDDVGNTALHLAVEGDKPDVVHFLLRHDAPTTALDDRNRMPIHLAVELNHVASLKVLLKDESLDINVPDGDGSTPLHFAAWKDHPESAHLLLEAGALMCRPSRIGLYPLHVAAQNASSKTLQTMLDHAEKSGYKREQVLEFMSQDKFTPLHAAIASGELRGVKVCLEAGAKIDCTQEDGCNAIHLAASQGATEMLRVMLTAQPEKKSLCISARDNQDMTPLHKAALFNRGECVQYLLEQNADIEAVCDGGYTSILLAASKSSWAAMEVLYAQGADYRVTDQSDRNILHLIIKNGGKPSAFKFCTCNEKCGLLLDEKDMYGCTPLHYASMEGQLDTIESLLKLGALLNAKNNSKQSPLHFAARYGRYNTCKRLIDSSSGHVIVNETDDSGMTPIHVAALNGHTKVVKMLLHRGAGLYRDIDGNTPLHLAAANGYTQTMMTLVNVHPHLISSENKQQDTSLHVAARAGKANAVTLLMSLGSEFSRNSENAHFLDEAILHLNTDVCVAVVSHERWRDALMQCSTIFVCPVLGFIKHMPEVAQMVLDRCRVPSSCDHKSKDFHYIYDFRYLQLSMEKVRRLKENGEQYTPMVALNTMVKFHREKCLSHPVCLQYLKTKWCSYGLWFHMLNLLIYAAFLTSLTIFVVVYDGSMSGADNETYTGLDSLPLAYVQDRGGTIHPPGPANLSTWPWNTSQTPGDPTESEYIPVVVGYTENGSDPSYPNTYHKVPLTKSQNFLVYFILSFCVLNAIKEIVQMIQQKRKYFTDMSNALEWVLYITCGVFIGPFTCQMSSNPQWECGAVSVFLAWFNLLLFLQRFDFFGIYVVMFLEIMKTLLHVAIVFSVLITAFGLSFYILLNEGEESYGYRTPALSLMTTIVMMLGNIDYVENWVMPIFTGGANHVVLLAIMLILFVCLMPILLINLLIGLAVGDIEAVQRNARLKRLAMQVDLHTDIEKKLPQRILEKVDKPTVKVYPNGRKSKLDQVLFFFSKSTDADVADNQSGCMPGQELDSQTLLYQELYKQKSRIKAMTADVNRNYDMLKLIVQKMEIHTEADDMDEGDRSSGPGVPKMSQQAMIGWSSPAIRTNLLKQTSVINKWKNFVNADK